MYIYIHFSTELHIDFFLFWTQQCTCIQWTTREITDMYKFHTHVHVVQILHTYCINFTHILYKFHIHLHTYFMNSYILYKVHTHIHIVQISHTYCINFTHILYTAHIYFVQSSHTYCIKFTHILNRFHSLIVSISHTYAPEWLLYNSLNANLQAVCSFRVSLVAVHLSHAHRAWSV